MYIFIQFSWHKSRKFGVRLFSNCYDFIVSCLVFSLLYFSITTLWVCANIPEFFFPVHLFVGSLIHITHDNWTYRNTYLLSVLRKVWAFSVFVSISPWNLIHKIKKSENCCSGIKNCNYISNLRGVLSHLDPKYLTTVLTSPKKSITQMTKIVSK